MKNLRFILTAAFALLVTINQSVQAGTYRFYDGATKSDDQIASVILPTELDLISIDNKDVSKRFGLFRRSETEIHLEPGAHSFVLRYSQIWDIDADEHEKIKSPEVVIHANLLKGETYSFNFEAPKYLEEARKLQDNIEIVLASSNSNQIFESEFNVPAEKLKLKRLAKTENKQAVTAPLAATSATTNNNAPKKAAQTSTNGNPTPLSMLKDWWHKASPQERKDFQIWLIQQSH